MGNEKAVLKEIRQNNQVNVNSVFKQPNNNLGEANQFYREMPNQILAESDDPKMAKRASEIIQNLKVKKQMKDAFYQALWKQKHGNQTVTVQRHPTNDQQQKI